MERGERSGIWVSGWHRMGYTYSDGSLMSEMLVKGIKKLHQLVGNAIITNASFIIFGGGATQLLNAAVYAFSSNSSSLSPAKVVTTAPSYPVYKIQTKLFNCRNNRYEGDTSLWKNNSVSQMNTTFIEFVTSPNNPDGKLNKAVLNGSNVKTIHDLAYYWPHFTAIPSPADEDLMIFTISKLTGHAGTRFGGWITAYAWLKCEREEDENCYEILKAAKIEGREGSSYGAYDRYVRLSLIGSQDDFEILIDLRLYNTERYRTRENKFRVRASKTVYLTHSFFLWSLNSLLFMLVRFEFNHETWEPSWSRGAAKEAEKVAGIECSGHGRAYLDGLILNGHNQPLCDCNTCYAGPNCSLFLSNCSAHAESGDPYFLEPFWMGRAESSGILVSGWHRMGYNFMNDGSLISEMLVKYINKLHHVVGNAIISKNGSFIVFGCGSTQLLNAAVYAFSPNSSMDSPAKVVTSAPYYPIYRTQMQLFNSRDYRYEGDTSLWKNNSFSQMNTTFIEFVTSPNNPDGKLNKAILNGSNVKTIHDFAYFWPHFTAIPSPADEDLMIFTISKLTGHAGTRFGWAIIKDKGVYERMSSYLSLNTMGVSRDAQLRALKLLGVVLEGDGTQLFKFAYSTMKNRWTKLKEIFSNSKRFSLQKLSPEYCTFFKTSRDPTPAYAWVKCEREEDRNCYEILKAAKIEGREGSLYSAEDRYVRLSLIKTQDDFDILINYLTKLVHQE
ncbi:tryptophan aminotransferase-related protein 4-like [Senna tora]|uniref:Tryptophan aminotransferase-related protein 4-like n=1 Tax=Senna tora TaxID=362788 RepID=A0A834TFQ3_9FABA|nr:tryptophan aminotransferase-related protein 4-like [Senna tora]